MTEILAANERSFNKSYLKEKSIFQFHFTQQVLRYKPEGRGFDSRWINEILLWLDPSGSTMTLGSTQPVTEMSTRNISWGLGRLVYRGDNLATFMYRLPRIPGCLKVLQP